MRDLSRTFTGIAMLSILFSCGETVETKPANDDTGTEPQVTSEAICDDLIDNDNDGLVDCEDVDCAEEFHCTWPDDVDHDISIFFDASSIAELLGYDDCEILADSVLSSDEINACPTCDRSYTGALHYPTDTCTVLEKDRPESITYGLIFLSETERAFYGAEAKGKSWVEIGSATAAPNGAYTLTTEENVDVDGFDAGDVTIVLTFTDRSR
jgi:hypothetical protein